MTCMFIKWGLKVCICFLIYRIHFSKSSDDNEKGLDNVKMRTFSAK